MKPRTKIIIKHISLFWIICIIEDIFMDKIFPVTYTATFIQIILGFITGIFAAKYFIARMKYELQILAEKGKENSKNN